ncbi:MAG: hypothetical protein ACPGUC_07990 [Gammaproteobacteria bacterium]
MSTTATDHLVSAASAARLLGLTRRAVQSQIQAGSLPTFEGQVRVSDLESVFPAYAHQSDSQLEQCERAKASARPNFSLANDHLTEEQRLQREITQLRHLNNDLENRLVAVTAASERRGQVIEELRGKLENLQSNCERREAEILGTLTRWLIAQSAERQR